jgi:hypothetical protein
MHTDCLELDGILTIVADVQHECVVLLLTNIAVPPLSRLELVKDYHLGRDTGSEDGVTDGAIH